MSLHPVTLNSTGNTTGPTRYYCQPCNTRKPGTEFRVYPTGRRGKLCRECRAEQVKAWKRATSYTGSDPNGRPRRANAPEIRMPPDHLEINGDAARAIWARIVKHAVDEMRATRPRTKAGSEYAQGTLRAWAHNRAEATCWLGSRQATPVFEMLGYDQDVHLPRIRWSEYARAVLDGQAEWGPLAEDRVRLLEDGIRYLRRGAA